MRFKRLPLSDLQQLEKEFINFLASSGITADDWKEISKNDATKADELIDLFSDIVFEKVFIGVRYLDFRGKNEFKAFHLMEEEIHLIGIELPIGTDIDFNESAEFNNFFNNIPKGTKIVSTSKKYVGNREDEIYEMMENGCCVIDKTFFQSLAQLTKS